MTIDTRTKLSEMICDQKATAIMPVPADSALLITDLGLDSYDVVELSMQAEVDFEIELDLNNMTLHPQMTFGDLVALIDKARDNG